MKAVIALVFLALVFLAPMAIDTAHAAQANVNGDPVLCNKDLAGYDSTACMASLATNLQHELERVRRQNSLFKKELTALNAKEKVTAVKNQQLTATLAETEGRLSKTALEKTSLDVKLQLTSQERDRLQKTNSMLTTGVITALIFLVVGVLAIILARIITGAKRNSAITPDSIPKSSESPENPLRWDSLDPRSENKPAQTTPAREIEHQGLKVRLDKNRLVLTGSDPNAEVEVDLHCAARHSSAVIGMTNLRRHVANAHPELLTNPAAKTEPVSAPQMSIAERITADREGPKPPTDPATEIPF